MLWGLPVQVATVDGGMRYSLGSANGRGINPKKGLVASTEPVIQVHINTNCIPGTCLLTCVILWRTHLACGAVKEKVGRTRYDTWFQVCIVLR